MAAMVGTGSFSSRRNTACPAAAFADASAGSVMPWISEMSAPAMNMPGFPLRTMTALMRPVRAPSSISPRSVSRRSMTPLVRMLTLLSGRSKTSQATPSPSTASVSAAWSAVRSISVFIRSASLSPAPGAARLPVPGPRAMVHASHRSTRTGQRRPGSASRSEPRPDDRVLASERHLRRLAALDLDRDVPIQLLVRQVVARRHPPLAGLRDEPADARGIRGVRQLFTPGCLQLRGDHLVDRRERLIGPGLALETDGLGLLEQPLLERVELRER